MVLSIASLVFIVGLFVHLDFPICQDLNDVDFGILHKKLCV